jgi:hypothetical protein
VRSSSQPRSTQSCASLTVAVRAGDLQGAAQVSAGATNGAEQERPGFALSCSLGSPARSAAGSASLGPTARPTRGSFANEALFLPLAGGRPSCSPPSGVGVSGVVFLGIYKLAFFVRRSRRGVTRIKLQRLHPHKDQALVCQCRGVFPNPLRCWRRFSPSGPMAPGEHHDAQHPSTDAIGDWQSIRAMREPRYSRSLERGAVILGFSIPEALVLGVRAPTAIDAPGPRWAHHPDQRPRGRRD